MEVFITWTIAHAPNSSSNCPSQLMAQMDIWLTCSPLTLHPYSLKVSQTWHNPSEIQGYMIIFSSAICYKFLQQIANLVQIGKKWWSVLHWQTRLNLGSSAYFCLLQHWTRSWCSLVSGSWSVTKSNYPGIKKGLGISETLGSSELNGRVFEKISLSVCGY